MTDKERLEDIDYRKDTDTDGYIVIDQEDYEFLYEQSERVQELEDIIYNWISVIVDIFTYDGEYVVTITREIPNELGLLDRRKYLDEELAGTIEGKTTIYVSRDHSALGYPYIFIDDKEDLK